MYAEVFERGQALLNQSLSALGLTDATRGKGQNLVAINTLPWPRTELVRVPGETKTQSSSAYKLVRSDGGIGRVEDITSLESKFHAKIDEPKSGVFRLSNNDFAVQVENGVITSLVDLKAQREIVPQGSKANQLVLFDDKPLYWQAWDVEVYHLETRQELASEKSRIAESGPERVSVVSETKISEHSWAKTTISLAASVKDSPSYVEMEMEVEWRESMKFLKVEFPVDIRNTEASYETQYGVTRRPTHYNTR